MLDKILVPLDGSANSSSILTQVRRLLLASDAEVVLFHVVEAEPGGSPHARTREIALAREGLLPLRDALRADGARAELEVRHGVPAVSILDYAHEIAPSLVAMSTHGRTGWSRMVRGSVAERVLRYSHHPLLLVRPEGAAADRPFDRILVPMDGSEFSARILPAVEDLSRLYGSEVVLEHAVESAPRLPAGPVVSERTLAPWRDRIEKAGIRCRVRIDHRAPPWGIVDAAEAEGAGLIALTTHGRSGPSRWVFGSVAESVIRRSTTPLLVGRTACFESPEVPARATA
mgnify:CR=1 FL=1